MNTIIRTAYHTHPTSGAGRITAKGMGRQRTIPFDPAKSSAANHGEACGALVLALAENDSWVLGDVVQAIDEGNVDHDSNDSGTKHGFVF